MSEFSWGETAVRFPWLLISGERTHDEPVIQTRLRMQACLHTHFPALWPEALARMGGNLATGKRVWGRGQRAAILSGGLPRGLNHLQPPWRKCAVKLESRTRKDRQKERRIHREEGTFGKLGKEPRKLEISVGTIQFLSHHQLYQPCLHDSQESSCLDRQHRIRELISPPWWESLRLCQSVMLLVQTLTSSYWTQISLWITDL